MSFLRKLFGAKYQPSTPLSDGIEKEWQQFFELVPIHESARSFFKSFVGSWPTGITPTLFAGDAFPTLIERIESHINGPYPLKKWKYPPRPKYQIVNGKISRVSGIIDMMICNVIPRREMKGKEVHIIVWHLIEKHSSSSLARLLFTLPYVNEASKVATKGGAGIIVIEDVKIHSYKGIENVIFAAYESLPEGGYLSEGLIDRELRKLLPS